MRAGEPSRTALGAAVHRAIHQELEHGRIFHDPLAWQILDLDRDGVLTSARATAPAWMRLFIAVRHRFAEDGLAAAVARGTTQVVVLGAGLDTFAYRNPYDGVRVFEVDHPATGRWKAERLRESGIAVPADTVFVGCDFEREDFLERLAAAGFDPDRAAYFLWLGVVPYLSREAVTTTLALIGTVPGAEVAFDYPAPLTGLSRRARVLRRQFERRVADLGEPLAERFAPDDMAAILRAAGLTEIEDLGRAEIMERYLDLPAETGGGGGHVVRAGVSPGRAP